MKIDADRVNATLVDQRVETISLFEDLDPQQREHLARDAWSIGLRALANAYAQSQQVHLQDVGKSLMGDLGRQLKDYVQRQQETTNAVLQRYFDPSDGELNTRLRAFLDDEGVLARLLKKNLSPDNGQTQLIQSLDPLHEGVLWRASSRACGQS